MEELAIIAMAKGVHEERLQLAIAWDDIPDDCNYKIRLINDCTLAYWALQRYSRGE